MLLSRKQLFLNFIIYFIQATHIKAVLDEYITGSWFMDDLDLDTAGCQIPCTTLDFNSKLVSNQRNLFYISFKEFNCFQMRQYPYNSHIYRVKIYMYLLIISTHNFCCQLSRHNFCYQPFFALYFSAWEISRKFSTRAHTMNGSSL